MFFLDIFKSPWYKLPFGTIRCRKMNTETKMFSLPTSIMKILSTLYVIMHWSFKYYYNISLIDMNVKRWRTLLKYLDNDVT